MNKQVLLFCVLLIVLLSSCGSSQKIAYFQPPASGVDSLLSVQPGLSDLKIKPNDVLAITVVSSESDAAKNYNLITPQVVDIASGSGSLLSQPSLQNFLVNKEGEIDYPVLGKLRVMGLSRTELENLLQEKVKHAFSNERPVITVRFANFSVNVLGEVTRPGKYTVANDRITLLDALAQAGDLTIYGRRDNIKVLRENQAGKKIFLTVSLNDLAMINSPAYYLEQNDVVYVEPNQAKMRSSKINAAENLGVSLVSTFISLTSLLVTILK